MTNINGFTLQHAQKVAGFHDLQQQCLRILRCTAAAMANSPGGLRFKTGTRPWLEGIASAPPVNASRPAAGARDLLLSA